MVDSHAAHDDGIGLLAEDAGRLLCWVLSLYAFAVFGYVTALLASLFVGHDAADDHVTLAGKASVEDLQAEILALREEVRHMASRLA